MARIRTIKPDFWKDEKIMDCMPLERLLFIGLWNFVDDYGRIVFAPRTIRADIFPEDGITSSEVQDMLMSLCSRGLITVYTNAGKTYLAVTNWEKHQRIDNKAKPRIPGPFDDNSTDEKQMLANPSEESEKIGLEREREREREEEKNISTVVPTRRKDFADFWFAYPGREGANPKTPAEKLFWAAVKAGEDPQNIIRGARACAARESKNVGTPYIPQAVKWLRDKRWLDYLDEPALHAVSDKMPLDDAVAQFAKLGKWSRFAPVSDISQVSSEVLAKHGLMPDGRKIGTA